MLPTNLWKTVKLPPALHAQLKSEAAANGLPIADLLEMIISEWLRRRGLGAAPTQRPKSMQPDLLLVGDPNPQRDT